LFSHLLSSSKSCLVDAVRLMTDAQIQSAKVGDFSRRFESLFGVDAVKEEFNRVRFSPTLSEMEKLSEYKIYFAGLVIKNFRTVLDCGDHLLLNYQDIAIAMDEIIERNNFQWDEEDILGWVNIYFSLSFLDSQRRRLQSDKTKNFLWQLLKSRESEGLPIERLKPEVLTFFLIMHWPSPNQTNMINKEQSRLLSLCVKYLDEFYSNDPSNRIQSYFKLCLDDDGRRVIQSWKGHAQPQMETFSGLQNVGGGSIVTRFPGVEDRHQLTIRSDPNARTKPDLDLNDVRFWIKFTNNGPIAYNVVDANQDEVARISRNPSVNSFILGFR